MKKTCMLCEQEHEEKDCTVILLTAAEEAAIVKRGLQPPEDFSYCKACWGLMSNPDTAPRLMSRSAERQMLKLGVPAVRAKQLADRYHDQLVERLRNRQHKLQA